jgi:hypothetical protein
MLRAEVAFLGFIPFRKCRSGALTLQRTATSTNITCFVVNALYFTDTTVQLVMIPRITINYFYCDRLCGLVVRLPG